MKYLLDTNICIYIIKRKPEQVVNKLMKLDPTEIGISVITYYELIYGVNKSQNREKNEIALRDFLSAFEVINWTESDAETSGQIRTDLEKNGNTIGSLDIQIAGQAVSKDLILVTNNEKEFSRINGLKLENWIE